MGGVFPDGKRFCKGGFTMKTRMLGDMEVSTVGLGCMGFTHAYGDPMDEKEAVGVIHAAVDMGYTFFDTAHRYLGTWLDGSTAYNEELVGKALAPYRGKVKIATKCGIHVGSKGERIVDSRPEQIRSELEMSLKQLGVETIDLYYQHRPDPNVPEEDVAGLMSDLIREGKILRWGISEVDAETLRKAHAICPVTCIQNRYSMMARWHESLFPTLEELNIGFVAFSPLANGFLSDAYHNIEFHGKEDYRSAMPQFKEAGYKGNEPVIQLIRKYAREKNATPAQISLAWMLAKKPYIVPIPGSRRIERLKENAGASEITFTESELQEIDKALDGMNLSVFSGTQSQLAKVK